MPFLVCDGVLACHCVCMCVPYLCCVSKNVTTLSLCNCHIHESVLIIFRSSPGDDLITCHSGVSVRTSTKKFSDFDPICCVLRPGADIRTSVTSTPSKVKVKVTELMKFRKLQFSMSVSYAIFAWSSKLMIDGDSMGLGLQHIGAQFWNFLLGKLSREFKLRPVSIFDDIQLAIFR